MVPDMGTLRKMSLGSLAMPALVVLVGLSAFGLGRISADLGQGSQTAEPLVHTYVGSRSGSVYYVPTCKGAGAIAAQNKVWFESKKDAEAAGYKPAANCPGLYIE